jgi:hypothetical protein
MAQAEMCQGGKGPVRSSLICCSIPPKPGRIHEGFDPLTTKDAQKHFPEWTDIHKTAFEAIKALVTSRECLTTINHENPGENKIFVTCDASDWRTGGVLSFGTTWESAQPVAFDSIQFKGAEKHYPIHEKELLSIVRALKKWQANLLGGPIYVYTNHRTLENFDSQKELSHRQLRWQEYMSQFEMSITYIKGEDNTVADALSRLPADTFEGEEESGNCVASILKVSADDELLKKIQAGYKEDDYCKKMINNKGSTLGLSESNGLWYVGSRLLIPRTSGVRESLFCLAHDNMGHFGKDKSYHLLKDDYYWPNMRKDLEEAYIPSCAECQWNKSTTWRPRGPLHPLPIPDKRGDSVTLDFIGPLPADEGYDCILTMTDRLGSDIHLVPTRTDIAADHLASQFFEHWYCENGLPLEIILDRDKLFTSKFWRALHTLTGVDL